MIKAATRSNLTVDSISKLMTLKIEGPDIANFNFDAAFSSWCEVKDIRIFKIKSKSTTTSSSSNVSVVANVVTVPFQMLIA